MLKFTGIMPALVTPLTEDEGLTCLTPEKEIQLLDELADIMPLVQV